MKFSRASGVALAAVAAQTAFAAPSANGPDQLTFDAALSPTSSLSHWIASSINGFFAPIAGAFTEVKHQASLATTLAQATKSDKTIYDVITTDEHFTQLAKAVNYSSESTKDLLKGKTGGKLTLFAPANWHKEDHKKGSVDAMSGAAHMQSMSSWDFITQSIAEVESEIYSNTDDDGDDDEDKKRKLRRLAHFIDAVLAYHLIDVEEPLLAKDLVQNSSVATKLSITGKAADYLGDLNDNLPLRLRVGKSLLPIPGVYLNLYSRVVYPDVHLANGVVHVVKYPLFQSPSILQGLYWASPFSTTVSALQKVDAEGYLALPKPKKSSNSSIGLRKEHSHRHHPTHGFSDPKGIAAGTFFAPSNAAWDRLPFAFRAYLFSPWGEKILGKLLMLHSLPEDIVYADSVHHIKSSSDDAELKGETTVIDDVSTIANIWASLSLTGGDDDDVTPPPHGSVNVTRYVLNTVLPKLKHKHHHHHDDDDDDDDDDDEDDITSSSSSKYEQVVVEVFRYYLLPGQKGPLQTRIAVQGVAVLIQDIPHLNGPSHLITRFIRPRGFGHGHHGKDIWEEVRQGALKSGFLTAEEANDETLMMGW